MRYRELYEARAMIRGNPVLIVKNPSPDVLFFHVEGCRQGIARGTLIGNDVFVFDAYLATHADIETFFGVPVSNMGFDVAERNASEFSFAAPEAAMPELRANPCVAKILADPRVEIA